MNNFIQLINVKGDFFNSFVFQVRAHITFFYYKILILFYRFPCTRSSRRQLSAIVFASLHPFNITLIDLWRLFVGSRKLFQKFFYKAKRCSIVKIFVFFFLLVAFVTRGFDMKDLEKSENYLKA